MHPLMVKPAHQHKVGEPLSVQSIIGHVMRIDSRVEMSAAGTPFAQTGGSIIDALSLPCPAAAAHIELAFYIAVGE